MGSSVSQLRTPRSSPISQRAVPVSVKRRLPVPKRSRMTLALAVAARSSRNAVVAKCECHVSQPHRGGLSVIKESSSSYEEHPYKCTKPPRRPYTCDALSITEMASEIKLICQKSMGRSQDVFIFILFFNHYKSDNRCDLCRCTVRSSSARPIYPRNRRGKIRRLASHRVCCAR